eukprot:2567804-Amphidinium_carterae.1
MPATPPGLRFGQASSEKGWDVFRTSSGTSSWSFGTSGDSGLQAGRTSPAPPQSFQRLPVPTFRVTSAQIEADAMVPQAAPTGVGIVGGMAEEDAVRSLAMK